MYHLSLIVTQENNTILLLTVHCVTWCYTLISYDHHFNRLQSFLDRKVIQSEKKPYKGLTSSIFSVPWGYSGGQKITAVCYLPFHITHVFMIILWKVSLATFKKSRISVWLSLLSTWISEKPEKNILIDQFSCCHGQNQFLEERRKSTTGSDFYSKRLNSCLYWRLKS